MRAQRTPRRRFAGFALVLAVASVAALVFTATAGAGGSNYVISTQTGQAITPGVTDTGNHCDECTTPIAFPFTVYVYGFPYSTAYVDSNGTIQFTSNGSIPLPVCLPSANHGRTLFPFWNDLYTLNTGYGIYTATTGTSPNRRFYVEWRAQ